MRVVYRIVILLILECLAIYMIVSSVINRQSLALPFVYGFFGIGYLVTSIKEIIKIAKNKEDD